MIKVAPWIEASRPKTLVLSLCPVIIGTIMAFKQGYFHPFIAILCYLFALLIQVGTNLANDYFDYIKGADTSSRKGPRRITQAGVVSLKEIKRMIIAVFLAAAFISATLIYQGGWPIALLAICSIALGILYTGGPYPLAYLGLGDLFVVVFFGPVATAGTYYLLSHHLSLEAILAGFAPGLLSNGVLIINNLRDVEEDRKASKKTLPVRFGKKFGQIHYAAVFILSALIPPLLIFLTKAHFLSLASTLSLGYAIPLMHQVFKEQHLSEPFAKTVKCLALYTAFFCLGWLL